LPTVLVVHSKQKDHTRVWKLNAWDEAGAKKELPYLIINLMLEAGSTNTKTQVTEHLANKLHLFL